MYAHDCIRLPAWESRKQNPPREKIPFPLGVSRFARPHAEGMLYVMKAMLYVMKAMLYVMKAMLYVMKAMLYVMEGMLYVMKVKVRCSKFECRES